MRASAFNSLKKCMRFDKRCLIAYIITAIVAIITGIVLCKTVQTNPYMLNYATEYVYFVYNFRSISLFLPRLVFGLVYGYLYFIIAYCTRWRLLVLPVIFLRCMMGSVYAVLIISVTTFGGIVAAFVVYIPSALVCLALNVVLIETVRFFNRKFAPFLPALFALLGAIAEWLLLNVLFRAVIAMA